MTTSPVSLAAARRRRRHCQRYTLSSASSLILLILVLSELSLNVIARGCNDCHNNCGLFDVVGSKALRSSPPRPFAARRRPLLLSSSCGNGGAQSIVLPIGRRSNAVPTRTLARRRALDAAIDLRGGADDDRNASRATDQGAAAAAAAAAPSSSFSVPSTVRSFVSSEANVAKVAAALYLVQGLHGLVLPSRQLAYKNVPATQSTVWLRRNDSALLTAFALAASFLLYVKDATVYRAAAIGAIPGTVVAIHSVVSGALVDMGYESLFSHYVGLAVHGLLAVSMLILDGAKKSVADVALRTYASFMLVNGVMLYMLPGWFYELWGGPKQIDSSGSDEGDNVDANVVCFKSMGSTISSSASFYLALSFGVRVERALGWSTVPMLVSNVLSLFGLEGMRFILPSCLWTVLLALIVAGVLLNYGS